MRVLGELESLLDGEAAAIRAGNLSDLPRLASAKHALLHSLGKEQGIDATRIAGIRAKAARNAELLSAAARGVKSALSAIADARSGRDLATYDRHGHRNALSGAPRMIERKF